MELSAARDCKEYWEHCGDTNDCGEVKFRSFEASALWGE